jgi:hypothetical protein
MRGVGFNPCRGAGSATLRVGLRAKHCKDLAGKARAREGSRMFFKMIAAAALASVSLLTAPVASADSDSDYLQELGWIGITPATTGRPPVALVGMGRATCGDLAQGADPNLLAAQLQGVVRLAQSQSPYTMGQLWVTTAVTTLCPNVLPHPLPWAPQHP